MPADRLATTMKQLRLVDNPKRALELTVPADNPALCADGYSPAQDARQRTWPAKHRQFLALHSDCAPLAAKRAGLSL